MIMGRISNLLLLNRLRGPKGLLAKFKFLVLKTQVGART